MVYLSKTQCLTLQKKKSMCQDCELIFSPCSSGLLILKLTFQILYMKLLYSDFFLLVFLSTHMAIVKTISWCLFHILCFLYYVAIWLLMALALSGVLLSTFVHIILFCFFVCNVFRFSPEMLGRQGSSALVWFIIEVVAVIITMYITNILSALRKLDLVAFCGYKYVRWGGMGVNCDVY